MWTSGDQIVLRFTWSGDLAWVEPVTVVEDSPELIALYLAIDTPIKRPVGDDRNPIPRFQSYETANPAPWRLGDGRWREHSVLWLARPGSSHAIGVFWRGVEREFVGWYGDLQAPLERTAIGFDTSDHVLDVTIAPDRTWCWKDEDEFAIVQQRGVTPQAKAAAIRAEGERVIAAVEANDWPFNAGWEQWQLDPAWTIPDYARRVGPGGERRSDTAHAVGRPGAGVTSWRCPSDVMLRIQLAAYLPSILVCHLERSRGMTRVGV